MRNKVAKKLKMDVALAMYVGDDVSAEDVKKGRKDIYVSEDFKPVYRARKKNYNRHEQTPKHLPVDNTPAEKINAMMEVRKRRKNYRKVSKLLKKRR